MAPTVVLDDEGLVPRGRARRHASPTLTQVLAGILDEGLAPQAAVDRHRLHSTGALVHLEPGFGERAVAALEEAGYEVRAWDAPHHYFGGVSVVGRTGAGADPRRSGAARSLPRQGRWAARAASTSLAICATRSSSLENEALVP